MSTQPLLSGMQATAGASTSSSGNAQSSQAKIGVTTSEVVFEVRVPGVSKSMTLPKDERELPSALKKQTTAEKSCDVGLSARVGIRGTKADDVAEATNAMQFSFNQLMTEFEAMGEAMNSSSTAADKSLRLVMAQQFHEHVKNALTKTARGDFARRESTALMADFSSAESLLEQGVEGYTRAVRKALKTDLDDSVRISFKNMSYIARTPELGTSSSQYPTIGSTLYNVFLSPFVLTYTVIRNAVVGKPLVAYKERRILDDISGLIDPGRLTLILGPPGCGKTTLLKALSGKLYQVGNTSAEMRGSLKFNGTEVATLKNLASWVSYVRQSDEHQHLLTTRETLEFAFKCRKEARYEDEFLLKRIRSVGGDAAVQRVTALKDIEVDIALAVLGLTNCAETIIGNDVLKGVSGGEKRRVTLGEMLVTGAQIMCCDEISTGLDSAATFDITKFLRSAAHVLGQNMIVALLQPAPEVLNLFDDLIVMAEGRIIYHGPRENVQQYFEGLGFRVPKMKDLGDFIVELPTRNGLDFQLSSSELAELGLPKPPFTAQEFADRWKASEMFKHEMAELDKAESSAKSKNLLDHDLMPEHGFFAQLWIVIVWSMTLRLRAKEQVAARLIANAVVGGFFGTLFFNLQLDDWWLKAMLFCMALMFLISTAFPTVQVISQQKPIFLKMVEAKFYSAPTFVLAQFIVSIPFCCFDVAFFATSMYWMCNLARHTEQFAIFTGICILFGISGNAMMGMFPFITPDQDTAIVVAALVLILMIVASGAISTESMIPLAFRWMLWINPMAYGYRALAINEYQMSGDYEMKPCKFEIVGIKLLVPDKCADYFLSVREVRSDHDWVWIAAVVQVVSTIIFVAITIYAVAYIRFDVKRVGAVAMVSPVSEKGGNKTRSSARRVQPSEDDIRNDQNQRYLNAISPARISQINTPQSTTPSFAAAGRQPSILGGGMNATRQPAVEPKTLVVRDLWYTIPNANGEAIDYLQGVSFWAKPGRMTALMGSSGAGKSTLMDVISGRKTVGYARGSIMVNNSPKNQAEFSKYSGYVEQFGVHAHAATVQESLEFSAALRLPPSTTWQQRNDSVEHILHLLELDDIRDALAGTLSMEQNKRLTLGVELIANPSIVFCDEPTSGLDARAAAIVMSVLLKVARNGRTVVCTIHQPSTAVFSFFDDLLLLKRGGQVVYFGSLGENSKNLIDYLESVPGSKKFEKGSNPATYMLDCIGAGTGADAQAEARRVKVDYAHAYEISQLKRQNDERLLTEFPLPPPGLDSDPNKVAKGRTEERTFVRGFNTQLYELLKRNWYTYYRSPEFSLNRIAVVMMFTMLFAGFFWHSKMETVGDVEGRIVLIFFFSSLSALYSLYTLVPFAMARRALYYRERAAYTYSVAAYSWAEGFIEIPYIIVQLILTVPVLYYVTNMPYDDWERPIYFTLMIFMILLLMTSMAFFMSSLFSDPLAAQLASIGVLLTLMVFCGIMVPRQNLPTAYVPMYYFSFFKYSSEGLLTTQFHNLQANICVPAGKPAATGILHRFPVCTYDGSSDFSKISGIQIEAADFVLNDFAKDYKYDNRWFDIIMLGAWIVGLRVFTYLTTLFISHQKR